jgi:endonuclease/exonuclease/phosphatase family metal-dependent hydrolase
MFEKLDRVFSSVDYEVEFFSSFLTAMGSSTSDHNTLLLSLATKLKLGRRLLFEAL